LKYSDLVPAPSFVYQSLDANGPWEPIGGGEGQPYYIQTTIRQFGYFAAGYPADATRPGQASQVLPIVAAALILGVLIAGIPLAMLRRRAGVGPDEADETNAC
jgi:hypothetical protein